MGRQWFSWGGRGGRSSSSGEKTRESPRKPPPANTTAGCMCAVLQIFDLPPHRSLSSFLQQQDDHFEPTPKGVEAPRNSLEVEEIMVLKPANVAFKPKGQETKILNNVSVGINQIRTSCEFSSSECSSSSPGGARTPNLVARLMGLDLLPENINSGSSPASTLSSSSRLDRARYLLHRSGTLSLPETPRVWMNRKSDVEIYHRNRHQHHHHRLSLQINKENVGMGGEDDEASKRVKRIVKHLKESRKFGQDITNTAAGEHRRQDSFLDTCTQVVLLKPNRPSAGKVAANDDFPHAKNHSPRLLSSPKTEDPPVKQPQKTIPKPKCHHQEIPNAVIHSYKNTRQRKPPPQKEETFVRPAANTAQENKKGVKRATPLSSPNNVPTILPAVMRKDRRPSPAQGKSVQKLEKAVLFVQKSGSLLSSSPSLTYRSPAATTAAPPLELEYIQRVLKRAGIEKETPVTSSKWHSYSHPLNPSIFHYMELFHHSTLKRRSDRKLIFHLADELLAGILKSRRGSMNGSDLAEALCFKIRELPSRECHVLEDIDALIDGDLKKSDENERDEEVEGMVGEIERYVVEALVGETAAAVLEVARPYRGRRRREGVGLCHRL
ncbi:unnamed protein product [Cuscuta campestris]|uniref:DUF3741 domain-containing protein n=1 Tax=Cuscuta campestris TaxID=132261 RepID=A0A484LMI3_9ASTE|nr:unnamed protein product [Cuscuta campestris]